MSIRSFFLILFLPLLLVGCTSKVQGDQSSILLPDGSTILVEVADTFSERRQGLSGRESLEDETGLLFIHETKLIPSYWMKDMLISLDFIWLDEGYIVDLTENVPPEEPPITFYSPVVLVDNVLEVNAGFIEKHSLSVGDYLDIDLVNE